MEPKIVISCLLSLDIFSSTFAASCDNIIRLSDLRNTIKNQTKQSEIQTRVIEEQTQLNEGLRKVLEDQGNMIEDQRSVIENQARALNELRKKLEGAETGKTTPQGCSLRP